MRFWSRFRSGRPGAGSENTTGASVGRESVVPADAQARLAAIRALSAHAQVRQLIESAVFTPDEVDKLTFITYDAAKRGDSLPPGSLGQLLVAEWQRTQPADPSEPQPTDSQE